MSGAGKRICSSDHAIATCSETAEARDRHDPHDCHVAIRIAPADVAPAVPSWQSDRPLPATGIAAVADAIASSEDAQDKGDRGSARLPLE